MSRRYTIEKITDIFAIPEDRFDDFLVDLKSYHQLGSSIPKLIDEVARVGGIQTQTVPTKMTWIDDGKHEAKIVIDTKEAAKRASVLETE